MKRCPSCDRTYPDTETFCENDGTALVGADPAFVQGGGEPGAIACPVCGGKAQPGELICNFCGTRLPQEGGQAASTPPQESAAPPRPTPPRDRTAVSSQPLPGRTGASKDFEPPREDEEATGSGGILRVIAYIIAAIIALVAGAWLAIHLSTKSPRGVAQPSPAASASSAPSPAAAASPTVSLASRIPIQITGESAAAPERSASVARNAFSTGSVALLDAYQHVIAGDATFKDGMLVRLRVMPDGTVPSASVVTSTSPNPGLDAEVIKDVSLWTFPPFHGREVEVSYPIIFAQTPDDRAALETQLSAKIASLNPAEAPEYSSAVTVPSAAATPAPAVEPRPSAVHRRRPPRPIARPRPTVSLNDQVNSALRANRKFSRVKAYAGRGGEVTLVGKVFDDNAKALAERTVRAVPGVTHVIDTLTTDTSVWAQEQANIQQQLANAGLPKVTVKVIGKDAYLNGTVKTDLDKQRAVTITQGAAPVIVRGNLITVVPGNMFGF